MLRFGNKSEHSIANKGDTMRLAKALWNDETGAVVCAEAVLLVTLAVVGGAVGLATTAKSIGGEFHDIAFAFRSLDQSYCYKGFDKGYAWSVGSCYQQSSVKEAHKELRDYEHDLEKLRARAMKKDFDRHRPPKRPHRRFDNNDD